MVQYTFDEALTLLSKNYNIAKTNLSNNDEDIAFLKDQLTITEVNISRVHNHGVWLKQQNKDKN
jgi:hypothetical protein